MAPTRVLIIANPAAGAVTPELVWEVLRTCRRLVRHVSVRWTTEPGEARRIAWKAAESAAPTVTERALAFATAVPVVPPPGTAVVAVGGDGTVREVADGLASAWQGAAPTQLLIVPGGTANSCYRGRFGSSPWQSTVTDALRGVPALAA